MSDPIRSAASFCAVVGVLNVLGGALVASFASPTLGVLVAGEGALYLGLALGISRESRVCAYVAAALYTLGTLNLLRVGLMPGGLIMRGVIAFHLWRAALRIDDLKELDQVGEQRRQALAAGRPLFGAPPPPPPHVAVVGPRPSSQRTQRMAALRMTTATLDEPAALEPRRRGPRRVCARCGREHGIRALRCDVCRVQLFDD